MTEEMLDANFRVFTPVARSGAWVLRRRTYMSIALAVADLLAIGLSWVLALVLRFTLLQQPIPHNYEAYAGFLPLILLINLFSGLYNHNISEVEELRRITKSICTYFLIGFAFLFIVQRGLLISRLVIFYAWVLTLAFTPILREVFRTLLIRFGQWGEPVVIFGNGKLGNEIASYLRAHPKMGYNPVGVVDRRAVNREECADGKIIHDADVFTNGSHPDWMQGVRTAFLVVPETKREVHDMLVAKQTIRFEQLILVRSADRIGSLWVQPVDIGGILGLEVGQNLLNRWQLLIKRTMDLTLILLSSPFLALIYTIVGLAIRLDSPGPVFYKQERIGLGGKRFKMWKFRSMHVGADDVLQAYLDANPDRKAEYELNRKLKDDPRVTRVGRIIRKLSLDEFPQFINVLTGEMSLVGPRPFMPEEIGFYDQCYSLYTYVQPGVSGLWQISGRSNVSYSTRVSLDDYYLRNWSIWLDLHILIRTVLVVLRGRGSY